MLGSDIDGDTLTYSLSGDDANLFAVDSDGMFLSNHPQIIKIPIRTR